MLNAIKGAIRKVSKMLEKKRKAKRMKMKLSKIRRAKDELLRSFLVFDMPNVCPILMK